MPNTKGFLRVQADFLNGVLANYWVGIFGLSSWTGNIWVVCVFVMMC